MSKRKEKIRFYWMETNQLDFFPLYNRNKVKTIPKELEAKCKFELFLLADQIIPFLEKTTSIHNDGGQIIGFTNLHPKIKILFLLDLSNGPFDFTDK